MSVLKHLHGRMTAFLAHRRRQAKIRALSEELLDLVVWSIMIDDCALAECLQVPYAVGGFDVYDDLVLVPLDEVSPKAIRGVHRFVKRAMKELTDSQRADLLKKMQEASKFFVSRQTENIPHLRLVHSR